MRNPTFSGAIEILLVLFLTGTAALAFIIWGEYACGALLVYAAVRILLRDGDQGAWIMGTFFA